MKQEQYDTMLQAIEALRKQGYTEDFNLQANCLDCRDNTIQLEPHEFEIDKVFRFYGPSDVDDESILYAISSEKFQLKGILVNGYGVSADPLTAAMVRKLS
ncbi:MAG TPA: phosphoribosylpyrophosphate synthetase [Saprospiraceae bacterium]|jgi:hypothetical protein